MRKKILLIEAAVWMTAAATAPLVAATYRQIEVEPPSTYRDAVIVTRVTVGGMEVHFKRPSHLWALHPDAGIAPFEWGDDWLENIEIQLFNRTTKTIVAGRLDLVFSDLGGDAVPRPGRRSVFLDFGRRPANAAFFGNGQPIPQDPKQQPLSWGPGQTIVIRAKDYIDKIRLQTQDRVPTQIFVIKHPVFFSDGMRWDGNYYVPDPAHPGRWLATDPLYFPGDREDNWPLPGQRWIGIPQGGR